MSTLALTSVQPLRCWVKIADAMTNVVQQSSAPEDTGLALESSWSDVAKKLKMWLAQGQQLVMGAYDTSLEIAETSASDGDFATFAAELSKARAAEEAASGLLFVAGETRNGCQELLDAIIRDFRRKCEDYVPQFEVQGADSYMTVATVNDIVAFVNKMERFERQDGLASFGVANQVHELVGSVEEACSRFFASHREMFLTGENATEQTLNNLTPIAKALEVMHGLREQGKFMKATQSTYDAIKDALRSLLDDAFQVVKDALHPEGSATVQQPADGSKVSAHLNALIVADKHFPPGEFYIGQLSHWQRLEGYVASTATAIFGRLQNRAQGDDPNRIRGMQHELLSLVRIEKYCQGNIPVCQEKLSEAKCALGKTVEEMVHNVKINSLPAARRSDGSLNPEALKGCLMAYETCHAVVDDLHPGDGPDLVRELHDDIVRTLDASFQGISSDCSNAFHLIHSIISGTAVPEKKRDEVHGLLLSPTESRAEMEPSAPPLPMPEIEATPRPKPAEKPLLSRKPSEKPPLRPKPQPVQQPNQQTLSKQAPAGSVPASAPLLPPSREGKGPRRKPSVKPPPRKTETSLSKSNLRCSQSMNEERIDLEGFEKLPSSELLDSPAAASKRDLASRAVSKRRPPTRSLRSGDEFGFGHGAEGEGELSQEPRKDAEQPQPATPAPTAPASAGVQNAQMPPNHQDGQPLDLHEHAIRLATHCRSLLQLEDLAEREISLAKSKADNLSRLFLT